MAPFFSVCIPAYNAGKFLSKTIDSVLAQTYTDFEIVILDNASTDNTKAVLALYVDSRIQLVTNSQNVPAHENWTRTIGLARGEWVKLLCADDLLKPSALQQIHDDLLEHSEVMVHAGVRDVINESGNLVKAGKNQYNDGSLISLDDLVSGILSSGTNPLGESMCLTWKRSLIEQVGPFSEHWKYFIDLDYWLRLAKKSKIYYTSEVLGSFRVSRGSWTSSIGYRTTQEAKDFLFTRDEFSSCSKIVKYRATTLAVIRTIARQVFLSFVLRKERSENKSK
jgi:glycosyltransferase involved in cell wall biosynthesis